MSADVKGDAYEGMLRVKTSLSSLYHVNDLGSEKRTDDQRLGF